jgi:phosphate uptake regulator
VYVTEDKDFTPLEAMDYRMFCEKIEDIGSILRDLHLSEEIKDYFTEIKQYFNEVMIAYQKKALELAHKVWKKRDMLVEKGNLLINDLGFKEKEKIRDLMRIAYNCKDMAALI